MGRRKEGTAASWVQGPPFVQRTTVRDVFDSTAIWDELLFCHYSFKFICMKLSRSLLLGNVDLLVARNLNLALWKASIICPLFCSLV